MITMGTTTERGEKRYCAGRTGCLAAVIALLWSGVCAAQIRNPSFEQTYGSVPWLLPSYWTLDGDPSFDSYCTDFGKTEGNLSACVSSRSDMATTAGEFQGFYQLVDLTGVGGIIFDANLASLDGGAFGPFEASFIVTSMVDWIPVTVWSKSAEGLYLDQVVDVSGFTGVCMIEVRLTALMNGWFTTKYAVFWDNFGFCDAPAPSIGASIRLFPDALNLGCIGTWDKLNRWVACFIELQEGYDVTEIDGSTVFLNDVPAYLGWQWWAQPGANIANITDVDWDGIPERMVKFERADVEAIVGAPETTVTVYGLLLDGTMFQGTAVIKVIDDSWAKRAWRCKSWKNQ